MLEASIDKFGQFPIIQIGFLFIALIGGLLALRQGRNDRDKAPSDMSLRNWYFEGPVVRAIEALNAILNVLKETRRENDDYAKERREQHKEHMHAVNELRDRLSRRR